PIDSYLWKALLAAVFLGPLCGLLGVFVTARRMSFFSDTVSHAALAGVALGYLFGFSQPTLPLVAFSLLVGLLLMWLKDRTNLGTDTLMAVLLSGTVALGIVIFFRLKNMKGELDRLLLGDILGIDSLDVAVAGILAVVVSIGIFWKLTSLTLITAHEDMAHVSGVPVRLANYLFVATLALTVSLSIRLVGIVLVTSLLVIPAAASRNISRSLRQQILTSIVIGLGSGVGGTLLSVPLDVPSGPTIVLTAITVFILTVGVRLVRKNNI
ncbi:MAG: hypothetical protein JWN25_1515, partial [Verrucomicrobiales bacterium]|nr:hypothetical protein [Verrucomicrobiales bacterium]